MTGSFHHPIRDLMGLWSAFALSVAVLGCGPETDRENGAAPARLTELSSPAATGSQTPHLSVLDDAVIMSWWEASAENRVAAS